MLVFQGMKQSITQEKGGTAIEKWFTKKMFVSLKNGCIFLDRRGGSGNSRPFLLSIPPLHLPIKKSNN